MKNPGNIPSQCLIVGTCEILLLFFLSFIHIKMYLFTIICEKNSQNSTNIKFSKKKKKNQPYFKYKAVQEKIFGNFKMINIQTLTTFSHSTSLTP